MSKCSCIKGSDNKFSFNIESLDCETLLFKDLSSWMEDDNYIIPSSYTVTFTHPISNRVVDVEVRGGDSTIIKGSDLETSVCIPDGVYCVSTFSCGTNYTKYAALTCTLYCRLDTLISQAEDKEDFEKISNIKNYIESVHSNARMGKVKKASEMFNMAKKELDKLNCDCS